MPQPPPALTERFLAALALAQEIHGHQRRLGTQIPYLAHLLVVTGLVMEDGGDEDQAIAAMLHDAVEDGGGRPTLRRIARSFGPRVAEIVAGCTDNLDGEPDEAWIERKRRYLTHLATIDDDAVLRVALADKVHNARSIVREYRESGLAVWERFTQKTARDQLWYYGGLLELFEGRRPGALTQDLWRAVGELAWLVAQDDAGNADVLRLWLDPDLHHGQAPEGWVQVRSPQEATQLLELHTVDSLSLHEGPEAGAVIAWLLERAESEASDRWPAGALSLHGRPSAAAARELAAATERHAQLRGRRPPG